MLMRTLPASSSNVARGSSKGPLLGFLLLAAGLFLIALAERFQEPSKAALYRIVVASEKVTHADIAESVVLVLMQNREGALGLRLNQPDPEGGFFGGAVERDAKIYALHSLDVVFPETKPLPHRDLGLLEGKQAVSRLDAPGKKPAWHRVFKGYSGWGKRQLERDIDSGLWFLAPYDEKFIRETNPEDMWKKAHGLRRMEKD